MYCIIFSVSLGGRADQNQSKLLYMVMFFLKYRLSKSYLETLTVFAEVSAPVLVKLDV